MLKCVVILPAFFLLGAVPFLMRGSSATPQAAAFKVPPDAASKVNPVKPTPEGLAHAKKMWGYDCAMCHGKEGAGDGDLAGDMHLKLRDYRDPTTLKGLTDGEIYSIIAKGKGKMTGEEDRMKPELIWDIVNYIRSLAQK